MIIIPAIDLKDGQCVRLRQGRFDDLTVFGEDPVAMAAHWVEQGATRLHLVDLDGAIEGKPVHGAVIKQICQNYPDLDVQIGGGIRSEKSIDEYLQAGVKQVIIGTRAVNEPEWIESIAQHYPQQLIIGLDAKNGLLAVDGWKNVATLKAVDLAIRFSALPVYGFVYTDISRDGMLTGVNIETTLEMAQAVKQPVIASGGIANIDDIKALLALGEIYGAITGRAIYEGRLDFTQAQKLSQAIAS